MKSVSSIREGLFLLIKSLEKAEKRNFKLFISKQTKINDKNDYIRLFDLLDKQATYDERVIITKLNFDQRKLACIKHLLYELILTSLRHLYSELNPNFEIRTLLDKVEILYTKKLYIQSHKMLVKAKKIIDGDKKHTYLPEVTRWAKKLFIHNPNKEAANTFFKECREITIQVSKEFELTAILNSLRLMKQTLYTIVTEEEHKILDKILSNPLFKIPVENHTFKGQLSYYEIQAIYNYLKKDNQLTLYYYNKIMELWKSNFNETTYLDEDYQQNLFDFLLLVSPLLQKSEYIFWFEQFRKNKKKQSQNIAQTNAMQIVVELFYQLHHNRHFNPQEIVAQNKSTQVNSTDLVNKFRLNYYMGLSCFLCNKSSEGLKYINNLLQPNYKFISIKQQGFIRILELLSHYELGNLDFLDHLHRSVYRFFSKNKIKSEFELKLIKYFKKLYNAEDKGSKKDALLTIKQILEKFPPQKIPWRTFEYNIMLAWVKSQLTGRMLIEEYRLIC